MKSSTLGYSDWALSGPSVNLLCFTHDVSVFSSSSCIFFIFPIDLLRVGVKVIILGSRIYPIIQAIREVQGGKHEENLAIYVD